MAGLRHFSKVPQDDLERPARQTQGQLPKPAWKFATVTLPLALTRLPPSAPRLVLRLTSRTLRRS